MPGPEHTAKRCLRPVFAAMAAACAAWAPAAVQADERAACLAKAAARDLAGKVAFQNGLLDLIVDGKVNFEALATLNRDLQVSLAESRAAQLTHLANNHPERVETEDSVSAFRNFDWTGADEAALRRDSEAYRALAGHITDLRRRSDGHPDWPKMRAFFAEVLATSAAYRSLTARLTENDGAVAAVLKSCPPP